MRHNSHNTGYFLLFWLSGLLSGCIFVKGETEEREQQFEISPKPEVRISEELVRSRDGDMIAFLPENWFFIDAEKHAPADIFAVAVNEDYTLSAVFSELRHLDRATGAPTIDSPLSMARASFEKRTKKTAGAVRQVGKFSTIKIGPREFGAYEFSSAGGALRNRTAVFRSSLGNYYEFSLVPLTVTGRPLPPDSSVQKIFRSILTTVQY